MSDVAVTDYDEPPDLLGRNVTLAGHLLASAAAFFFLAFVFAYVYLRSLNNDHLWHPKHVQPPVGLGTAFAVLVVLSASTVYLASRDERAGLFRARAPKLAAGLALGVSALVVQAIEWGSLGFGPTDGGYASVFVGWTAFLFLFVLLALVWVEIQFATTLRAREVASPGLGACSFFWTFIARVALLTFVVLFLVSP
jgi:cytochrome c oxidase subunit 3